MTTLSGSKRGIACEMFSDSIILCAPEICSVTQLYSMVGAGLEHAGKSERFHFQTLERPIIS